MLLIVHDTPAAVWWPLGVGIPVQQGLFAMKQQFLVDGKRGKPFSSIRGSLLTLQKELVFGNLLMDGFPMEKTKKLGKTFTFLVTQCSSHTIEKNPEDLVFGVSAVFQCSRYGCGQWLLIAEIIL